MPITVPTTIIQRIKKRQLEVQHKNKNEIPKKIKFSVNPKEGRKLGTEGKREQTGNKYQDYGLEPNQTNN